MSGFVPFVGVKARCPEAGATTLVNLAQVLVVCHDPRKGCTMLELGDDEFIAVTARAESIVEAATRGGLDFAACLGKRAGGMVPMAINLGQVREMFAIPTGVLVYLPGRRETLADFPRASVVTTAMRGAGMPPGRAQEALS